MEDFFDNINYSDVSSPIDELSFSNLSIMEYQFNDDTNTQTTTQNQYQQKIMNKAKLPRKKPIFRPHCKWSKEEDEKLKELIIEYGENDWRHLAKKMEGRNSRQCRERWNYYLNPRLKHGKWTEEEDSLIIQKHQEIGPRWMEISKLFENRTDAMIKNRYNYLIRNQKRQNKTSLNSSNFISMHDQNTCYTISCSNQINYLTKNESNNSYLIHLNCEEKINETDHSYINNTLNKIQEEINLEYNEKDLLFINLKLKKKSYDIYYLFFYYLLIINL